MSFVWMLDRDKGLEYKRVLVLAKGMRSLYARQPRPDEREALEAGLRSKESLTIRRCQMILLSADEQLKVDVIGQKVGRSGQTVRETISAFNDKGVECVYPQPVGRQDDQRAFDDVAREQLRELVHRSPRELGHETSLWTLKLLAQVSYEQGLTTKQVHFDTVSETLLQMGLGWKRAKKHIQSPDEQYDVKKNDAIG